MKPITVNRWAVIKWGDVDAFVEFDHKDPTKFYWGGTYSHCYTADPEIVKDYGYISSDNYKKIEEIELDFFFNFNVPKKATPFESAGWISPEGDFYPCKYFEHDSFGKHLAVLLYKSFDGVQELEKHKWIRVLDSGLTDIDYNDVTQKQLNIMYDIYTASVTEKYKKHVYDTLNAVLWNMNKMDDFKERHGFGQEK